MINLGAISYLLRKTIKNEIIDTLRHPLKFLLYAFVAVSMLYGAIRGYTAGGDLGSSEIWSDPRLLSGAYLAVLFFISIPVLLKGLSSGTSFFSLSDVNNMFVAPVSPKRVLIYGVGRQLATMLVLVVTFAAYGGMIIKMFSMTVEQTVILILGIVLMLVMVQLVTLMIFCLASTHPVRASVMKYIIYAMAFSALGTVIIYSFVKGISVENLFAAISLPALEYIPFIGWMHGLVFGILEADIIKMIVFGSLTLLCAVFSVLTLVLTRLDFYEDVLSQAESYQEFREAVREGKFSDKVMLGNKEIKLRKRGVRRGKGATAIFHKHLLEGSRRSRFMFFNINTFVLLFVGFVITFGIKQAKPGIEPTIIYLAAMVILAYVQFFFSASGDWVKELTKPYIYLIPDGAVKKLVMAAATGLIKPYTDGIITFGLLAFAAGGQPIDIIVSMFTYGSFGTLYIAANILAQRLVGVDSTGGIFITFYISMIVMTALPGIIAGLVVLSGFAGQFGYIATTLLGGPMFLWNLIVSAGIFLACRNLLNNTE